MLPQLRQGPAATQAARKGQALGLVAENARRRLANEAAFRLRLGLHQAMRDALDLVAPQEQRQRVR
jgi:hypothetical protein